MTAPENSHDPMRYWGTPISEEELESIYKVQGVTWAKLATLWLRILNGSKDPDIIREAENEIIRMAKMLDATWAEEKHQQTGPPNDNL